MTRFALCAATCALFSISAASMALADDATGSASSFGSGLTGGIGYTWIRTNEYVFDTDNGNRASQLIWETEAPVVTLGANAVVMDHWTIDANLALGFNGDSNMKDYDWIAPNNPSYAFDDWTDRSLHPDTRLQRYIDFDIAAGHDFEVNEKATVNLHGGFKYTNFKASSYGGTYIYSEKGFRSDIGAFPDDARVITYEQRLPTLFVGAEATIDCDRWTFMGLIRGGATVSATDTDYHWNIRTRFESDYAPIPFISLGARVDYHVTEQASFFIAGNFDNYFKSKADVTLYDIASGAKKEGPDINGGGLDFRSFAVSGGLKVSF